MDHLAPEILILIIKLSLEPFVKGYCRRLRVLALVSRKWSAVIGGCSDLWAICYNGQDTGDFERALHRTQGGLFVSTSWYARQASNALQWLPTHWPT